jgi:hypothetical protein
VSRVVERASPGLRFAVGSAAVLLLTLPGIFLLRFLLVWPNDDEGYQLLSLRAYARGGRLYDEVFTQYGPAYNQLAAAIFRVLGLPFDHTHARLVALFLLSITSVACATIAFRLTRSVLLALAVQIAAAILVNGVAEPLGPGVFLALALPLVVVSGTFLNGPWAGVAAAVLGLLLSFVLLAKINIGGFALLSVTFALLVVQPAGRVPRALRFASTVTFALMPLLLMGQRIQEPWIRVCLLVTLSGTVAVTLVAHQEVVGDVPPPRMLAVVLLACIAGTSLSAGWELLRGTSPRGLLEGVVLRPLHQSSGFAVPPRFDGAAPICAVLGIASALLFVLAGRRRRIRGRLGRVALGLAKVCGGVFIFLAIDRDLGLNGLEVAAPFLWLALAGVADVPERAFGRTLLVTTASLQTLHVYPWAGAQGAWATFLAIPAGGVAVGDGCRLVAGAIDPDAWRGWLIRLASPAVLGTALLGIAGHRDWAAYQMLADIHRQTVPLDLPGATGVRADPAQAAHLRRLSHELETRCRTFVTQPGFNSFYLFTGIEPPTSLNMTLWDRCLSDAEQQRIVDALARTPPPVCAIRWENARSDTPLGRYIDREFVVQFKEGPYEFMIRRDARSDRSPGARALASGGDDVRGTGSERAAPRRNSRGASRQNHQAARSAPGTQTS